MRRTVIGILCIFWASVAVRGADAPAVVPAGTYANLLSNGKLELYAGEFPESWRSTGAGPIYRAEGAPGGGGSFLFKGRDKNFLIRQDWTFSIIPGEMFRLSAKVRARDFVADKADIFVFNNNWLKVVPLKLPDDTCDWKTVTLTFPGFESNNDNYSVGIMVNNIQCGELEIADIVVEPATASAFRKANAFLAEIPSPDLVPLAPRLNRIFASDPILTCRWFGDPGVREINFTVGEVKRCATVAADGLVKCDLTGVAAGKYEIQATAGDYKVTFPVTILPGFPAIQPQKLNNFHSVLAELELEPGRAASFVNPRDGWVLFRLPAGTSVTVEGSRHPLSDGGFVKLPAGKHEIQVAGKGGKGSVCAVTETSIYQLCGGPYPKKLPKHDWEFTKKFELPYVMTFYGGGVSGAELTAFRQGNQRLLANANIGLVNKAPDDGSALTTGGLGQKNHWFDGCYLDELALSTVKNLVWFIKNAQRLAIPAGREAPVYVCGRVSQSPITAKVFSVCANLGDNGCFVSEIYIPNITADETAARKLIANRLTGYARELNRLYPGAEQFWGVALCHSNVALNFTIDHEPEADHRVLLDMQMQAIATQPEFADLSLINFWGDNYSDCERTRWVMALLKHYVFEGKTDLLSKQYGFELRPGHLQNASFRQGLEHWRTEGKLKPGKMPGFAAVLKRFNPPDGAENFVSFERGERPNRLSQELRNLTPGKRYKVRYVTSNPEGIGKDASGLRLALNITGGTIDPASVIHMPQQPENPHGFQQANYDEAIFRAEKPDAILELNDAAEQPGTRTALHYVSVMPYFEEAE